MQPTIVISFRKRIKKRGYFNVKIKLLKKSGLYLVEANEPLSGSFVSRECSLTYLYNAFRF